MEKTVIGIDLGTTFSSAAYVDESGRARVIPNADGKTSTPSVVLLEGKRIVVGEVALNQWITNEEHVVRWIKRSIGDPDYRFQDRSAIEISAEILKALKADSELHLGMALDEAVITCPAYFDAGEIENTKRAGEAAGFTVREIVKEPTAAAVYFGVEQMREGETILVCDLGGGTFDATILSLVNGVFLPRATKGDRQLGGHDWTMELVELVAERFQERFGEDPRNEVVAGQMLYEACEQAKRDFARLTEVTIPCQLRGRIEQVAVPREEFESRTEWRIGQLVTWCEHALAKTDPVRSWKDIDRILLVGGSSRLRRMGLALKEASGKEPVLTGDPDLMVALGAAIIARGKVRPRKVGGGLAEAAKGGLIDISDRVKRVLTRSLGTRAISHDAGQARIANSLIIPHNTESPVTRSRDDYEVSSNGQQFIDIPVVEFEDDDGTFDPVDSFRFQCSSGARRGDRIKVTFHYDVSGIPTVEAEDLKSGRPLTGERLKYEEPDLESFRSRQSKPRWVVFAIDVSTSMSGASLDGAKKALLESGRQLLADAGCRVGIVSFSTTAEIVCRLTAHYEELARTVPTMDVVGTTAMDLGIHAALELLEGAPPGTDRDIVMLTDGMPDDNRRQLTLDAGNEASRKGVTLSMLDIGAPASGASFLQSLSPNYLRLDAGSIGAGMTTLLTQSAAARGGLREG